MNSYNLSNLHKMTSLCFLNIFSIWRQFHNVLSFKLKHFHPVVFFVLFSPFSSSFSFTNLKINDFILSDQKREQLKKTYDESLCRVKYDEGNCNFSPCCASFRIITEKEFSQWKCSDQDGRKNGYKAQPD